MGHITASETPAAGGTTTAAGPRAVFGVVLLALVLLGLSGFMAWEVPHISHVTAAHTDFIETLYGLRAFELGRDPYGNQVSAHVDALMAGHSLPPPPGDHYEHPFLYVLPPSLVYLPVTPLPDETAIMVVRAVTVALYLAALLALVWRFGGALPAAARAALLLLGLAWWPFLSVILPITQQTGTIFALLVLAALAAERGHWGWAGVAAYITLLKPTESGPVVLLLAFWALRAPAARRPFLAGLLGAALPTCAVAFAVRPTWPLDWLRVLAMLRAGHFDYNVDLLSTLSQRVGVPAALLWAAAVVAGVAWIVGAWRAAGLAARAGDAGATRLWWWTGLSCALTLLLVPRTGAYDVVIALVPWFVALHAARALPLIRRRLAYAALVALLAGAGLLAYRDHAALELPGMALGALVALWLCRPHGDQLEAGEIVPTRAAAATARGR